MKSSGLLRRLALLFAPLFLVAAVNAQLLGPTIIVSAPGKSSSYPVGLGIPYLITATALLDFNSPLTGCTVGVYDSNGNPVAGAQPTFILNGLLNTIVASGTWNLPLGTYSIVVNVTDAQGNVTNLGGTPASPNYKFVVKATTSNVYTVTFNPPTKIASGNEPFTLSTVVTTTPLTTTPGYTMTVNGPSDQNLGDYPMNVTYQVSLLSGPATAATALSYVNIYSQVNGTGAFTVGSPSVGSNGATTTIQFTGPGQSIPLYITEVIPTGAFAGNYLYQVAGTWKFGSTIISDGAGVGTAPSGATIQEYGASGGAGEPTINSTVTATVVTNNSPPTVQIIQPADEETFYISSSPGSTFPSSATVSPIIAEGDITTGANPVTGINLTWGPTSIAMVNSVLALNSTYAGYNIATSQLSTNIVLGDAVAVTSSPTITSGGIYNINAQAFNSSGSSPFATVAVNVISVPAPTIAISPANNAVLVIPVGATTVASPYLLTGTVSTASDNSTWNIDNASASLTEGGVAVAGFSPDFSSWSNSPLTSPTAGGTLPALGVGNYAIQATVSNDGGINTGTSFFTVAQAASPAVVLTGLSSTYTIPAGLSSVSPTFAFTGSTSGGTADTNLTSAAVTLNQAPVNPSTLTGIGTASISGNGVLANLAPGTYTVQVSDSNGAPMAGGGTATASQSFTFTVVQTAVPSISITAPGSSTITIPGGSPSIGVTYSITGGTSGGTVNNSITSASATLTTSGGGTVGGGFTATFGGVGGTSISDGGTVTLTAGTYTLSATDSNGVAGPLGTASQSVTFTVAQAAVPAIAITAPANGSTITIPAGSSTVAVPYTINGSTSGGTASNTITTASATLTATSGGPVGSGFSGTFSGLNSASATDSGNVTLSPGTYTLTATDSNGATTGTSTATQTITFTVSQAASPSISITAPVNGSTVTVPAGSTTIAVNYAITGTTNGTSGTIDNTITSASATLTATSGGPVGSGFTGTFGGLSTATATDNGTVTLSPGTYTLTATDSNGSPGATGSATQTITFTVAGPVAPTITINPPASGSSYPVGSGGTASVPYVITGTTPTGTNFPNSSSGTATLAASAGGSVSGVVQPVFTGFGASSTTITASGTFTLGPGTYTLTAGDTNSTSGSATATPVTFTVTASCTAPTSTNTSNFCVNRINGGNSIWFNSIIDVTGIGNTAGTLQFNNPTIAFTANGAPVSLAAPNATVTFSATATSASTTYDAPSNTFLTTVPVGYTGSIFLTGVSYPVSSTITVGSGAVTWTGSFLGSVQGATGLWQIGATIYSPFSSSFPSLGIKPIDSGSLCSYHTSDPAGTPENYTACNNGACCVSTGSGGGTAIAGLYATGVNGTGGLLAGGASDSHWIVTASTLGSAYLGNAYVDPAPLAGGWVANSSTAQWITAPGGVNIGNGGGNNGLPSSGSTAQTDTFDYTLTFSLPAGATVGSTSIAGTLSADDSVLVYVNGTRVTSNVPNATDYEYNTTASFTLNSSNAAFQAGSNTLTFRVANENSPTPKNASGLYVQTLSGTATVPQGQVSITYCASLSGGHSTQSNGVPPVVTPSSPASNASYSYSTGSPASVPVAFTAVSPSGSGNITAVSATLNGQAVTLTSVSGVNTSATATAGATLSISQAGTYTLLYTGTNAYGSNTQTVTFTVVQATPPTISITAPANAAQITIPGGGSTASVPYSFTGGTNYGTITAVSATLGSSNLSPSVTGLNSTSISGSGTLTLAAGTYTLTATDTNSAGSGTASVTFSVVSSQTGCGGSTSTGSEVLTWLQCNSFNSSYNCSQNNVSQVTVTGGAVVPVTFTLNGSSHGWGSGWNGGWDNSCNSSNFVNDQTVVISIYEIFSNGTSSTPVIYTYGASGPNPPYYSIGNNQYVLNYPTASGVHHYEVQVYHPITSSNLQLLGSEDIYTQANCMPSAGSCGSNFNGTSIAAGRCIWFNSVVNCSGISSQECTLWFDTSTINFTLGKTACSVAVPAACIKFDPNCTQATTSYNAIANCWVTSVPVGYTGNVFLTGLCYTVPSGFPTGLNPVTWTGAFRSDNGNCNAQWQWAAAVYTQCPSNPNSLGVKPCDSNNNTQYGNSDHAGTPENYKNYVTGGARGGGGSNWTGSYSGTIAPSIGSNCWMSSSVSNSGWGNDSNNGWGWGW